MRKYIDILGRRFGHLTVIGEHEYHISKSGNKTIRWPCLCDCGNTCTVDSSHLRTGHTTSCGCYQKSVFSKIAKDIHKKYNRYEFHDDYIVGYTQENEVYLISPSDYEKVKDICWYVSRNGYIKGMIGRKSIFLHRFIMQPQEGKYVDHINHKHEDNRRENLRIVSHSDNMKNVAMRKNNTSGCVGVYWIKNKKRWQARININGKTIYAGMYKNREDAICARKALEEKYFGEFSYDKSIEIAKQNRINMNLLY